MNVVVVESPAKAKTINKYLGPDYTVLASFGHVRDLPAKDGSVKPEEDFAMSWEVEGKSEQRIKAIAQALKSADKLILATDPDREGEAISWHISEELRRRRALGGKPVARVVFNEITKSAVLDAMKNPREVNRELVEAALQSGSLITARLAGEQGREVMAVPGSPLDPRCRGANQLIRQGATLVETAGDVTEALSGFAGQARAPMQPLTAPSGTLSNLSEDIEITTKSSRNLVEERLGPSPVAVDELLRQCQMSPPFLRMTLLELELAGRLIWHPGNRVSLLASGERHPDLAP